MSHAMMLSIARGQRMTATRSIRRLSDATAAVSRPVRKKVTPEERAALRAARKERATAMLQQQQKAEDGAVAGATGSRHLMMSRWMWYVGIAVPSGLLFWGFNDENSPPAKFSRMIGLTDLVTSFTDQVAKPSHEKLLPDWSQVSHNEIKEFMYLKLVPY